MLLRKAIQRPSHTSLFCLGSLLSFLSILSIGSAGCILSNSTNGNGHTDSSGAAGAMTAEQFGAYMEKRLTLYDEVELLDREGMELRLRVNGADVAADLGNFYIAYKRDPAQIDVVVQTFA